MSAIPNILMWPIGYYITQRGQDNGMAKPNLPKIGMTPIIIECTDEAHYRIYVAHFLTHADIYVFENLVTTNLYVCLSVGRYAL